MNDFEKGLEKYLGKKVLEKIKKIKIGIAGAGGLGSNCAVNLVRSGFTKFVIADFDKVESSNLNRQFYFIDQIGLSKVSALENNLKMINPSIILEMNELMLTDSNIKDVFSDCDIVVEAFDKADLKVMIVSAFNRTDKFLVSATGLAGYGKSDEIKVKKVNDKFYIVGDLITEANENTPPLSPRVNIAAAKQADIILQYVMDRIYE